MVLLSLLLLSACHRNDEITRPSVMVVVMDGVRLEESLGDGVSGATGEPPSEFLPTVWDRLLPIGVRATQHWNMNTTVTAPAHAAMVTGRAVPFGEFPLDGELGEYRPEIPTLFEILRREKGWDAPKVGITGNTEHLEALVRSTSPEAGAALGGTYKLVMSKENPDHYTEIDGDVLEDVVGQMDEERVRFEVINLHQVDRDGHFGSADDYPEGVKELDDPINEFWDTIQRSSFYNNQTWMFLVADHGRHSISEDDPVYRDHGCSCFGCRRVPFLLLGPGVKEGTDVSIPVYTEDIGPTAAALMRVEMPWAEGMVLDDLFEEPTGYASRSGLGGVARADGHRLEKVFLQDTTHRAEIRLDGNPVSSTEATLVDAPVIAVEGDDAWACWRELELHPDAPTQPWIARCLVSSDGGATWNDDDNGIPTAGPYWQASLLPLGDGSIVLAYNNIPNGMATAGSLDSVAEVSMGMGLLRNGAWEVKRFGEDFVFPIGASAARQGDKVIMTVGASRDAISARHDRDLWTSTCLLTEKGLEHCDVKGAGLQRALSSLRNEEWRLEWPTMQIDSLGRLWVAMVASVGDERLGVVAASDDRGSTWIDAQILDLPAPVMPHLQPTWLGDRVIFGVFDGDSGSVCATIPGAPPSCVDTGSPRILDLASDDIGATAIVDRGVGQWEGVDYTEGDFAP